LLSSEIGSRRNDSTARGNFEEPVKHVIDAIGDDRIVFSTDFPHGDSKFPRAVESFLRLPISEESKRKILWDNCAAYYGLPS